MFVVAEHRADHAQLVGRASQARKQLAEVHAAVAAAGEAEWAAHQQMFWLPG